MYWVIKKNDGELVKEVIKDNQGRITRKVKFFEHRVDAVEYIIHECGNSPYLHEEPWRE